ncbi:EthD family reductase [Paraburkholderia sp. Cy-641]|nr:EthD family reductase [Paraburkholderia sp. Cy-641]
MFKRMSVLVRRTGDNRERFSRNWERHAAPVARLPKVRGYIQNHVEEDFTVPGGSAIEVDGFVELLWDRPEDMAAAFASAAARPMVEDEPNFLGHGSGYAIRKASPLRESAGGKLIVAAVGGAAALDAIEARCQVLQQRAVLIRDDVADLIAKPGMEPPQPVSAFFHLQFDNAESARKAGHRLASCAASVDARLSVCRVRTLRFV